MHARFVTVEIQADALPELTRIYEDAVLPAFKGQQGFRGALFLSDAEARRVVSITLWETEPDMRAGETSSYFQAQLERVERFFTAPARREYFRVESLSAPPE